MEMCGSEFTKQYPERVRDFSSQYGTEEDTDFNAKNLIHDYFMEWPPENDNSSKSYLMRSYGPWDALAPCAPKTFKEKSHHFYYSQDFVELTYHTSVYPYAVEICEPNLVGAVSKIFACDLNTLKWHLLWERSSRCSRLSYHHDKWFTPPIRNVKFATNLIRVEFHHSKMEYFPEVRSVWLLGFEKEKATEDHLKIKDKNFALKLRLQKKFRHINSRPTGLNAISCYFEDTRPIGFGRFTVLHSNDKVLSANKSVADTRDKNILNKLPKEQFHTILKYLDLPSLCKASRCDKLFRQLCYDPLLFRELDLQPYWHKVSDKTLADLSSRCSNLQSLNLSWCGNDGSLSFEGLNRFFTTCCRNLTCLHLSTCTFVNGKFLEMISENCPKLKELDLSHSLFDQHKEIQFIGRFQHLLWLNLYLTPIDLELLMNILENCPKLRYLNVGSCLEIRYLDQCAAIIRQACRDLRGLNLWRTGYLTFIGVSYLAALTKLEELDIGWCYNVLPESGCLKKLAMACPSLKKLVVAFLRNVSDSDILCFAEFCVHLEQLDISGARDVTASSCYKLLSSCKKLKLFDVSFCDKIDDITYSRMKEDFPNVSIKRFNN